MGWKRDRDLLIAQTMAFVHSVTGKKPGAEPDVDASPVDASPVDAAADLKLHLEAAPAVETGPFQSAEIRAVEIIAAPLTPPRDVKLSIPTGRTIVSTEFRSEMQARVANFRAHQERFNREREEYFSATLTKLRAAIENASAPDPSDRAPPRR